MNQAISAGHDIPPNHEAGEHPPRRDGVVTGSPNLQDLHAGANLPKGHRESTEVISDRLRAEILAMVSGLKLESLTVRPTPDGSNIVRGILTRQIEDANALEDQSGVRWLQSVVPCREVHGVIGQLAGWRSLENFHPEIFDREQATFCLGNSLYQRISVPWIDEDKKLHLGNVGIFIHEGMLVTLTDEDAPHHVNLSERLIERGYMAGEFKGISSLAAAYLYSATNQLSDQTYRLRNFFEDSEHSLESLRDIRTAARAFEAAVSSLKEFSRSLEARRTHLGLVGDNAKEEEDFRDVLERRRERLDESSNQLGLLRADLNNRETSLRSDRDNRSGLQRGTTQVIISQTAAASALIGSLATLAFSANWLATGAALGIVAVLGLGATFSASKISHYIHSRQVNDRR